LVAEEAEPELRNKLISLLVI